MLTAWEFGRLASRLGTSKPLPPNYSDFVQFFSWQALVIFKLKDLRAINYGTPRAISSLTLAVHGGFGYC